MFKKLKNKWKVNNLNLTLILLTFASGGSVCGRLSSKILNTAGLEKGIVWVSLYILLVTVLWPLCVIIISIPLGQFRFFRNYIGRIGQKLSGKRQLQPKTIIAIFASGKGSNALNIIHYFKNHPTINVGLVVTNKADAGVVDIAQEHQIPIKVIGPTDFQHPENLMTELKNRQIGFVVLAGFLKKVPDSVIAAFSGRIINIHPALLPAYGGKGMYGQYVHEAVLANRENKSGITIHYVNEHYDKGEIIFQAECKISPEDDTSSLEQKVRALELAHYPRIIEEEIKKQNLS